MLGYLTLNPAEADKPGIYGMMRLYERMTCVRFVPWNTTTRELYGLANDGRLLFTVLSMCSSTVGNSYNATKNAQSIYCCGGSACFHELGHALGLEHEHFQTDSKDWIRNNWYYKTGDDWVFDFATVPQAPLKNTTYDFFSPMSKPPSTDSRYITKMFPELVYTERNFYHLRFISQIYNCKERNCSSFTGQCYNEGYVTLIDGKCSCHCPQGLDPATGCRTVKIRAVKGTFPGGSYAIMAPVEGCPKDHGFQKAVVIHKYLFARSTTSSLLPVNFITSSNTITTQLCVQQSSNNNAAKWPPGSYCLFRVGSSCPSDFYSSSVTFRTNTSGNWANFSTVDVGSNYVTFYYCCRKDGLQRVPMEVANTQAFILLRHQSECQEIIGMGVELHWLTVKDPVGTSLYNSTGETPSMGRASNGYTYLYLCYYFPVSDHPFQPASCVDSGVDCPSKASSGQCLTSSQVATDCPYSCDRCTDATNGTGSCIDTDGDCEVSMCPTYTTTELTACAFTCRQCPEFCGGVINLTRSYTSHVIKSPDFPNNYPSNRECYWMIVGPPDSTILLTFSAFALENTDVNCGKGDRLEINHAGIGPVGLPYCGTTGLWQTIRSINNMMDMRLIINSRDQRSGFNATVKLALPEEHCYAAGGKGEDYRGNISYTRDWKPCVPWNQTKACRHYAYASGDFLDGLEGNFCRNPGNGLRPWCYTNTHCDRNYCDVCLLETPYDTDTSCATYRSTTGCNNTEQARMTCSRTCNDLLPPRVKPPQYTQVKCGPPTPPPDAGSGYVLKDSYTAGENVSFACVDNANFSRSITCLTDGQWSPMGYVCGGCSEGWVFHDNLCFKKFTDVLTYDQARAQCQSLNGQLAEARTEQDLRFLMVYRDDGLRQWMGLRKDPKQCFLWQDGTQPNWTKWDSVSSSGVCAELLPELSWNAVSCSMLRTFVCQRPAQTSSQCLDYIQDCGERIQKSSALCDEEPDFAKFLCPKTCYGETCQDPCASSPCQNGGKCYVRGGSFLCVCSNNYGGQQCQQQIVTSNSCVDKVCECPMYRDMGGCVNSSLRHFVLGICPRSCGLCSGPVTPCNDTSSNCSTPSQGQCQQDLGYLLKCLKTCQHCVDGVDCVDQSKQCGPWADQGLCSLANVTQMCPHACNRCFNPNCYDTVNNCADSKAKGVCQSDPASMLSKCPYTCHRCQDRYGCYSKPCKNGGTCSQNSTTPGQFTCNCSGTSFTGSTCEQQ